MFHRFLSRAAAVSCLSVLLACGGGSSGPTPLPSPVPTPTPAPEPTPSPTPTPCTQGLCEEATTNTAPVVKAILRLYQLFDAEGDWVTPTPSPVQQVVKQPIPVGYTIRLDLVGKDASNKDTLGEQRIGFSYSDESMVEVAIQSDWQRKLRVLKAGTFTVHATYDGVRSNDLKFTFVE
jgi:hypothetical protein